MFINFVNTYSKLPDDFYQKGQPTKVAKPRLLYFNLKLAEALGINCNLYRDSAKIAEIFSGKVIPKTAEPIALAYAGHQFGYFVPQLGDGRALLLGEILDKNHQRFDIQLKGSGITTYSRKGDGRAALGPMLREYIVSEAMHALGIKTTRALAVVSTGEKVLRNGKMLPGAILTRVAASHIRIGTYEYFASRYNFKSLKILADYTINRHYPELQENSRPYIALLERVRDTQIDLVASWVGVGFIHGVMNTDNISIAGETLDYGPCAFIDEYEPNKVFSSIDYYGRYSFVNQANICHWNLIQFAKTLTPLIDDKVEKATDLLYSVIADFKTLYESKYYAVMGRKIGIAKPTTEDRSLIKELLDIMHSEKADYTLTFRYLSHVIYNENFNFNTIYKPPECMKRWIEKWRMRLRVENTSVQALSHNMLMTNPAIIPRNHKIEEAIKYAVEETNFSTANALLHALADPYACEQEKHSVEYMRGPKQNEYVYQTFCGT